MAVVLLFHVHICRQFFPNDMQGNSPAFLLPASIGSVVEHLLHKGSFFFKPFGILSFFPCRFWMVFRIFRMIRGIIYHKSRIFGYVLTNLGLKVVFIFFMVHFIVIVLFNSKSLISLIIIVIFVFDRYLGGRRTATLFLVFSLTFSSRLFRRSFINPKTAW